MLLKQLGLQSILTKPTRGNGKLILIIILVIWGKNIFAYSLSKNDLKLFDVKDKFMGEILEMWADTHFQRNLEVFEDLPTKIYGTTRLLRLKTG